MGIPTLGPWQEQCRTGWEGRVKGNQLLGSFKIPWQNLYRNCLLSCRAAAGLVWLSD